MSTPDRGPYSMEEIKEEHLDQFVVFLAHMWAYLNLPKPTRVQRDIAKWLQYGPKRAILQAFRGVGKSWITVAFVLWHLFLDPQKKIMVVSANESLAANFTTFCLQLIHGMPLLAHLAPRKGQRSSSLSFDVGPATPNRDPSVKSVGITGQLTGGRANIIIGDDIEVPKNSATPLLREKLAFLVKEFDAILVPETTDPDARIIYLGTPQVEQSLYNQLADEHGYTTMIWPAEIPPDAARYKGRLAPFVIKLMNSGAIVKTPVDPERFGFEELAQRLTSYKVAGYFLQFMLDTNPTDTDKNPLKIADIPVWDCDAEMAPIKVAWGRDPEKQVKDLQSGGLNGDHWFRPAYTSPEMAKYGKIVMAIDPSGKGTDETAYVVVGECHGLLYVLAAGGFIDGFGTDTLKALAGVAARWKVNSIIIEENAGLGMFNELLKPYLVKVERQVIDEEYDGWATQQKEPRIIDTLQPLLNNHKVIFSRSMIEADIKQQIEDNNYSLVWQLTRMQRVRGALPHEDRLDALASACAYFVEAMSKDQEKLEKKHKEALLDKEVKKFLSQAYEIGKSKRGKSPGNHRKPKGRRK